MNIREIFHNHLLLHKDGILTEIECRKENDKSIPFRLVLEDSLVELRNGFLFITKLETAEEYRIPYSIIASLNGMIIDDYILSQSNNDISNYSRLLVILHNIANKYNTRSNEYWKTIGFKLLELIRDNDIQSIELRNEIYSQLGIIIEYISYSSPTDYNFY